MTKKEISSLSNLQNTITLNAIDIHQKCPVLGKLSKEPQHLGGPE